MTGSRFGFSAYALKVTALVFMTIDHIGAFIPGMPFEFRMIGRLSAPIFFFVAANSLIHTSNRTMYIIRLYLASAFMELLRIIVFFFDADSRLSVTNNIFTTLFFVILITTGIEGAWNAFDEKNLKDAAIFTSMAAFPVVWMFFTESNPGVVSWALKAALPSPAQTEGGVSRIILGVGMCMFVKNKKALIAFYSAFCLLTLVGTVKNYGAASLFSSNIQWMMIFALPFFMLCNGKKGRGLKWLFYIYYPLHIWVLYFLGRAVGQARV